MQMMHARLVDFCVQSARPEFNNQIDPPLQEYVLYGL